MKNSYLALFILGTVLFSTIGFSQESRDIKQYFYQVGFKDMANTSPEEVIQYLKTVEGVAGIKYDAKGNMFSFTVPNKIANTFASVLKDYTLKNNMNMTYFDRKSDFQIRDEKEQTIKNSAKKATPVKAAKGQKPNNPPVKKTERIKRSPESIKK